MGQRHRSRRLALQGLCCLDVQGPEVTDLVRQFVDDSRERPELRRAAWELIDGVMAARQESDELLRRHARHWTLNRLALVDRNILRLGVYELLKRITPTKVVISEALQLAQEFSTAESPRFVNGVLDAVAREVRPADGSPGAPARPGRPPGESAG